MDRIIAQVVIFILGSVFFFGGIYSMTFKGAKDLLTWSAKYSGYKPHITKEGINAHRAQGVFLIIIGLFLLAVAIRPSLIF